MIKHLGVGFVRPSKKDIKAVSVFSYPVMASNIAAQGALNLAVLVIGAVAITSVVGNYGAAYKLARLVDLTITAATFILLGAFSSALSKKRLAGRIGSIYNNSIYYTAIFLFPVVAYGIANAKPLIRLLFSASYTSAPLFFSVMIAGMAVGIIGTYAGTLMISSGDTKKFMKYQLGAIAVQLALLLLLAPLFKAAGALIALFVITPVVLDMIYIRALKRRFHFSHSFAPLIRVASAAIVTGIVMAAIAIALHQRLLSLAPNIVVLVLVFPPLLAAFKGISPRNLEFIRDTGRRLRQLHYITDWLAGYTYRFIKD
jgi:O-antigen/teichoic acid export membrane protein